MPIEAARVLSAWAIERTEPPLGLANLLVGFENGRERSGRVSCVELIDVQEESFILSWRGIQVAEPLTLGHTRRLEQIV